MSLETDSLTPVHWTGVVLALLSGVIHLFLGVSGGLDSGFVGLSGAFVLAGLGFFGAVVLLLLDYRRRLVYGIGVPFVAVQIIIWGVTQVGSRPLGPLDYVDKAAQVILVGILVYLLSTEK